MNIKLIWAILTIICIKSYASETIIPLNGNEPYYYNFGSEKLKYFEITVILPSYYDSPSSHNHDKTSSSSSTSSSLAISNTSDSEIHQQEGYDYCCYFQQLLPTEDSDINETDTENAQWETLKTVFCENLESVELEKYYSFYPKKLSNYSTSKNVNHRLIFTTSINSTSTYLKTELNTGSLLGSSQDYIALTILVITYIVLGIELVNRVIVASASVFVTFIFLAIANKFPAVNEVLSWLDLTTLLLIFSMNVIVGVISTTGVFGWIGSRLFIAARGNMFRLAIYLWITTAVLSMFLPNVSAFMLMAPIAFYICEISTADPTPFIIGETIMANVGGAATLIGDPPNIIIGKNFSLNFISFIVNVTPCIILVAIATIAWLYIYYRRNLVRSDDNYVQIETRRSMERIRRSLDIQNRSSIDSTANSSDSGDDVNNNGDDVNGKSDVINNNNSGSNVNVNVNIPTSSSVTDHRSSIDLARPSSDSTESGAGSGVYGNNNKNNKNSGGDNGSDNGSSDNFSDGESSESSATSIMMDEYNKSSVMWGYVDQNEMMSGEGINADINRHHLKDQRRMLRRKRRKHSSRLKPDITKEKITDVPLLLKSCVVLVIMVVCFFLQETIGIDPGYTAVVGAITLTAMSNKKRIEDKLKYIDLETIVLLSTLFILVEGLSKLGLIRLLCK